MQKQARRQFAVALPIAIFLGAPIFVLAWARMLAALWVPVLLALLLAALPPLAEHAAPSMLKGLFDLDMSPKRGWPVRVFFVTLAAYCVAATSYVSARLMLLAAPIRFGIPAPKLPLWIAACLHPASHAWAGMAVVVLLNVLAIWVIRYAISVSHDQNPRRSLARMILGAAAAIVVADLLTVLFFIYGSRASEWLAGRVANSWFVHLMGRGYQGPLLGLHVEAGAAAALTLLLYAALGVYGRRALGKGPTVAALIGPLMMMMVGGWSLTFLIFWLGRWNTPVLLVIALVAALAKYQHGADHTYEVIEPAGDPMPTPGVVLTAGGRRCAILVAASGGGIQAAAWTAQVLKGLHDDLGQPFDKALCALSGISGGSMGSACYIHWLAEPQVARDPAAAASDSSLDEVAWGLAWPDLIRLFLPTVAANAMDRATAMEHAWAGNASKKQTPENSPLWEPLSSWNGRVARGELPALFMGSTMVDNGSPLILGTSTLRESCQARISEGWTEGNELHRVGGRQKDIPIVRGARLSASFPFVSSAARPRNTDRQPHMVDGGFFDNYGTATLIEWLDQALEDGCKTKAAAKGVDRVLLIQINAFPADKSALPAPEHSHQGWPYQIIAPLVVLAGVRTAGQISHRDLEAKMLIEKWAARGIEIEDVGFVFNCPDAPLSWHLMPKQKAAIADAWAGKYDEPGSSVRDAVNQVRAFLNEPDSRPPEQPGVEVAAP